MANEEHAIIQYSDVESKGLGLNVWRGKPLAVDSDNLKKIINCNNVDIAIISIPAEKKDLLLRLQETGFPLIFADILVYYSLSLPEPKRGNRPQKSEIEFVQFKSRHFADMDQLIADIFTGYQNHYTFNPLLSVDIVSAYQEWARRFNSEKESTRTGWMAKQDDRYVGFVTCDITKQSCEIMLTGVATLSRGQGVFHDILNFLIRYCENNKIKKIRVSTQIHNYISQKAYIKQGFTMDHALITVHLNSMLSKR